jgi:hypothetical protein
MGARIVPRPIVPINTTKQAYDSALSQFRRKLLLVISASIAALALAFTALAIGLVVLLTQSHQIDTRISRNAELTRAAGEQTRRATCAYIFAHDLNPELPAPSTARASQQRAAAQGLFQRLRCK